ncbi:hypothetical protein L7F22_069138 [Adiantum nelumboides]|nr:hypothetical protein [Adiantum nelumboides]
MRRLVMAGASSTGDADDVASAAAGPSKRSRATSETDTTSVGLAHRTPLPGTIRKASIQAGLQKHAIAEATRELTRMFIQCAISFYVLRTPRWRIAMRVVSRIGCVWEGPSYNGMRTRELRNEKSRI